MFSFRFPFVLQKWLCLVKFAGSAGNPESSGEFATEKPFIRKGKYKIQFTFFGLSDRNIFLILQ